MTNCIICQRPFSEQEARAGYKRCEQCEKPCPYCRKKIRPSYTHAMPFCTMTCGLNFARAAYRGGHRMVKR